MFTVAVLKFPAHLKPPRAVWHVARNCSGERLFWGQSISKGRDRQECDTFEAPATFSLFLFLH